MIFLSKGKPVLLSKSLKRKTGISWRQQNEYNSYCRDGKRGRKRKLLEVFQLLRYFRQSCYCELVSKMYTQHKKAIPTLISTLYISRDKRQPATLLFFFFCGFRKFAVSNSVIQHRMNRQMNDNCKRFERGLSWLNPGGNQAYLTGGTEETH